MSKTEFEVQGGCDCLIEEDVQQIADENYKRKGGDKEDIMIEIPDYSQIQKGKDEKSPFEDFNNDNDKRRKSFENLNNMIRTYTKALKSIMNSEKGSSEIIDDINFLLMDHNEQKMRSLFIRWQQEANSMINSLRNSHSRSILQGIYQQMLQLSMNILNEKIPNYKTYIDDVDLTLNEYKKHLKQEQVTSTKQVDNVKFTIDSLLEGTTDKQILVDEFVKQDKKLFERLDLYMKQHCTESSEEMQGYQRFKQLREHTMKTFMEKMSQYEKEIRTDIQSYKNHRPSEKEYQQLLNMYKELNDTLMNNESQQPLALHSVNDAGRYDLFFNDYSQGRFQQIMGDQANIYQMSEQKTSATNIQFSRQAVDQLYTKAFATITTLINNYEFLLRYCNAIKSLGYQFKTVDIKNVIIDLICNYYLIMYFSPGENKIFIRQYSNEPIQNTLAVENEQLDKQLPDYGENIIKDANGIVSWSQLSKDNAEYKLYNAISNIMYNAIKGLYGTFNLLIEYYLKPEKTLSQIISGGDKLTGNVQPIEDALPFYKLIGMCWDSFQQGVAGLTDTENKIKEKDLLSQLQLYTSSKFYDLYLYLKDTQHQDINKFLSICNKLWTSYSDNSSGVISQRCKRIIGDFMKELLENLISRIYINENKDDLDNMSYIYKDIKQNPNSLYTTAMYSHNDVQMQMQVPEIAPMKQKDNIIDTYMAVVQVINHFVDIQMEEQYDKDFRLYDKDYKKSILTYFQEKLNLYKKIKRPEQQYLYFIQYLNDNIFNGQSFITQQTKFIKDLGVALNQYTVFIGQAVKILLIYHKKYVEIGSFPKNIARVINYKLKLTENVKKEEKNLEIKLFQLFKENAKKSNSKEIFDIGIELEKEIPQQDLTKETIDMNKLQVDLANTDTLYTYILIKLLQMLEEGNDPQVINDKYSGINGGFNGNKNDILKPLLDLQIIMPYSDKHLEGNLPFIIDNQRYILGDNTFQYLQTHSPYMKYAYYMHYKEYTQMVQLLTSIPGIKVNNGQIDYKEFLQIVEKKKSFVMSVLQGYADLKFDNLAMDYVKKHLENGLTYIPFFNDVFQKYCPGPLPLSEFITFNLKNYLFDYNDWYYYFTKVYDSHGKMKITYKEDQIDRDLMVEVQTPFNYTGVDDVYKSTMGIYYQKQGTNNIQLEVIDEINYYIQKAVNILKGYGKVLPKDFADVMEKNNTIQQAMITTPIEHNGTIFNIPINTLQTPFKCPAIFGVQSQDQISGMLNSVAQGDNIEQRMKDEGCFFTNDSLELYMLLTQKGVNSRRQLTPNIKNAYKVIFDKVVQEQQIKNIEQLNAACRQIPNFFTDRLNGQTEVQKAYRAALQETINMMNSSNKLTSVLQYGGDILYKFDSMEQITQYQQWNVQYIKVNVNNYTKWKEQITTLDIRLFGQNPLEKFLNSPSPNLQLSKNIIETLPEQIPQNQIYILPLIIQINSGKVSGQPYTNIPTGDENTTNQVTGRGKRNSDLVGGTKGGAVEKAVGQETYNLAKSSKFQALSEALKKQYMKQINDVNVQLIYNKETQQMEIFQPSMSDSIYTNLLDQSQNSMSRLFTDKENPIIYMSTAIILSDSKVIEYNETQKYSLLYDFIKLKRQIKLFSNNLQGIQVPQIAAIQSISQSLNTAIDVMINKCKGILHKQGIGLNYMREQFGQYMFDPVQFIRYYESDTYGEGYDTNEQLAMYKKLYIQYMINEKIDIEVNYNIIANWFQINLMSKRVAENKGNLHFRDCFHLFQRAAFIKRKIPQKQIIGADHYWVLQEYPLYIHSDQPYWQQYGQNNSRGWYYKMQKDIVTKKYQENVYQGLVQMKDLQLVNISDNTDYADLFKFNYGFSALLEMNSVQPIKQKADDRQVEITFPSNRYYDDDDIEDETSEVGIQEINPKQFSTEININVPEEENNTQEISQQNVTRQQQPENNTQEPNIQEISQQNITRQQQPENNVQEISQQNVTRQQQPRNNTQEEIVIEIGEGKKGGAVPQEYEKRDPYAKSKVLMYQYKNKGINYDMSNNLLDSAQFYNPNYIYYLISPLSLMQEITFYAGITDKNTLSVGRDIYGLESPYNEVTNVKSQTLIGNVQYYNDTYKMLMKPITRINGVEYNKDYREMYINQKNGLYNRLLEFLMVTPCQFLYQVMSHDYRYTLGNQINTNDVSKYLFRLMGIEPFNPIQLIKRNLPFPIMQAISIYINTYEKKYLGPIEQGFGGNDNVIRLNQMYKNRPIYVICDNRNHPKQQGGQIMNNVIIDTSNGMDLYYVIDGENPQQWTLAQVKNKEVRAIKTLIPEIVEDEQVALRKDGYYLRNINGIVLQQELIREPGQQATNMIQLIFSVIPKYFYENSKLLLTAAQQTTTNYEKEPNGELIMKSQKKKYMW